MAAGTPPCRPPADPLPTTCRPPVAFGPLSIISLSSEAVVCKVCLCLAGGGEVTRPDGDAMRTAAGGAAPDRIPCPCERLICEFPHAKRPGSPRLQTNRRGLESIFQGLEPFTGERPGSLVGHPRLVNIPTHIPGAPETGRTDLPLQSSEGTDVAPK
eukprot:1194379-Prorocentrum_minimum.AAC.3